MPIPDAVQACLVQLEHLFARMDKAYGGLADRAGFHCGGCVDNCCRSLFYHHTVAEYLFLRQGLNQLADSHRALVSARALCGSSEASPTGVMCPLNEEGCCILYDYRPMICRLHGIPHFLRRPDGTLQSGPGCNAFYSTGGRDDTLRLDRTPLYAGLAQLEGELRRVTGFKHRMRLTIAQMVAGEVQGLEVYL